MKTTSKIALILSVFALLAGCSISKTAPPVPEASAHYSLDPEVGLAEAADSISHSLQELAAIEQTTAAEKGIFRLPSPVIPGMMMLASIDWNGPVGLLVHKIASATHYRVRTLGSEPAVPIIVSISTHNTPMATILRNAAYQAGKKAKIVVYPDSMTIELRYAQV